ncbi:MAG: 2-amino-4-ketopentanoate thiolase [Fretibacterium sp.]|nr:2-amino-4-ketopentanoate thiolase [Fretibacterium sp.]
MIAAGSWVQIEQTVLRPEERAPQIPEETKKTPLLLWTKGFLKHEARLGDIVEVETIIGRTLQGKLVAFNPPYTHGFGAPIPELLQVGQSFRQLAQPAAKEEEER